MIPWKHILDEQPEHGESIIKIEPSFCGHHTMGMSDYYKIMEFQEYLTWREENDLPKPNYFWILAKDFPFPEWSNGMD